MDLESSELQRRWEAVQNGLLEHGWACAVVTTQQNFLYLTGLRFDALWSSAARSLACVVPSSGPVTLVIPHFLSAEAVAIHPNADIVGYDPPRERIDEPLLGTIKTMPSGPVGLETGIESRFGASLETANAVATAVSGRGVEDIAGLLWELRMRKSPSELAALAAASRAGTRAFEIVFGEGVMGQTEREIARALSRQALGAGADKAEWVACTSGPGSYHRFVSAPRDRVIELGDMIWADIGLTSGGYWTDFCRAAVVGVASGDRISSQSVVIEATAAGIDRCRPGMPVSEVAAAIRRRAAELGADLLDYGRLGHGIGLSSTEPPSIAEWDPTVLAAGMVVTIEPALSGPNGLYCAEQVVVVTDDEPEVLTKAPAELTAT